MHIARIAVVACINFTDALLFLLRTTEEKTTPYKSVESAKSALPKKSNCNSIISPLVLLACNFRHVLPVFLLL